MATDSMQSFEQNKQFYKDRLELETLPELRRLLALDMEHLDSIQLMTASSREFYMILRVRNEIKGDVYSYLGNLEKFIHEQGFTVHRANEQELKKLLAVYYEQSISPDSYPDYDGQQYIDDGGYLEKEE